MTEKTTEPRAAWMLATLRSHPLLASLDDAALATLVNAGTTQALRSKRTFLRDGGVADTVYFLLTGAVRIYHRDGKSSEVLLKLLRAPAMFGEIEVIAKRAYVENVSTIEDSQVLGVPAAVFRVLLTRYPDFCSAVLADVANRFCVAAINIKAVAFADVRMRLAALLLDYAALAGKPGPAGEVIDAAVSQESLARDLAVSRKAVQNAMAELQRRGFMAKHAGRYVIADRPGLESVANLRAGLTYSSASK
ncbi:MAG: Crp/Fnr family transcriptional regulator [Myxococcota bacterium]|nr:Crp/Fnr family transcriptional regulator [Myxococcota bacterium]